METYKIISYTALFLGASFLTASCVKDDIYNTPHPTTGAIKITTDWNMRSSESVLPTDYLLRIGATADQKVTDATNVYHTLFTPGQYELLAYNVPSGMTINGNIATVNTTTDGNTIEALPGYLFSAAQTLDVQKDDTLRTTVKMQQRVRQLTLVLKLKEGDENRFKRVVTTLNGIATSVDLRTGTLSSAENVSITPSFELSTDAADHLPRLTTTVNLLGIIPTESQNLAITVTMNDGTSHLINSNLTDLLKNFSQSIEPLTLDANLELPIEMGASGSINDWTPGLEEGQGDVEAN
ncbi:FimB/Mfa2 family fimbrial subunit [Bacteroides faecium]|uniref:FimB/Mfa2 family fimbrial subunit n=1 Tax=Bacteroides faecium TaxID=2715212 RepID=A0A6H0KV60_9BACE|nr:FimB/Mfa2 family fimbrial subunit [Bacteroides faecium]QIU96368.1 FimB/Mfa2 family fimbrial subunit [Bacteroides faecium]